MESNYEGHVFGRLLVRLDLGLVYNKNLNKRKRRVLAECLNCSSGVKSYSAELLKSGQTKSCGCFKKQSLIKRLTKHGKSRTSTYNTWSGMNRRCFETNNISYENYGGRGITVCQRWANSFENFLEDMGERPLNSQLDRIHNNQGYSPENCRWVSASDNIFNQRKKNNNTSGRTGVYWDKHNDKWLALIKKNGKTYNLGRFKNIESAIEARRKAELKLFGFIKD